MPKLQRAEPPLRPVLKAGDYVTVGSETKPYRIMYRVDDAFIVLRDEDGNQRRVGPGLLHRYHGTQRFN